MSTTDEAPLSTEDLADRWKMKPETLEIWRQRGKGPKWFKVGEGRQSRVLYRMEDVKEYEKARVEETERAIGTPPQAGANA